MMAGLFGAVAVAAEGAIYGAEDELRREKIKAQLVEQAKAIAADLSKVDPANAQLYAARAASYKPYVAKKGRAK